MITWTLVKLFLGSMWKKVASGLAFMVEHWRVFLPVLIVGLTLWHINSLTQQRDDARTEYANHLAEDAAAMVERAAENRAKDASMQYIIVQTGKVHDRQFDILKGQYDALDKQKRGADRTNADIRSQLRRELEKAANATRLSCLPGGSFKSPESWPNGDSADTRETLTDADYIEKLELGCAITTADYNTLYERVEAANQIYGNK